MIFRDRTRWLITGLLFCISTVAYLDRQTLAVLEHDLEKLLGYGEIEYSYINAGFLVAIGFAYLFSGRIIERYGVKVSFAVGLTVWSVAAGLHSLAAGWVAFLVLRVFLGLGESFYTPAASTVLKTWIPQSERGVSWAVFSIGNFFGAMIALPLVAWLAIQYDWRFCFIATSAVGFVLLAAWLWFYDAPEKHPRVSDAERAYILQHRGEATSTARASYWDVLGRPRVLGFMLTRFFTDPFTYFFMIWLPRYFQTSRGFTLEEVGFFGWLPYLAADLGALSGGGIADWFVRWGGDPQGSRRKILLAIACLTPLTVVAVHVEWSPLAVGLIMIVMALQAAWNTNLSTLIIESTPPPDVATVSALTMLGGTIGGGISTLLAGWCIKTFGYEPVFTVLGFIHVAGYAIMAGWSKIADQSTAESTLP